MLRKGPGFTGVVVLSLGLGIGANATIFSFVNALLFRAAPVKAPSDWWQVWRQKLKGGSTFETLSGIKLSRLCSLPRPQSVVSFH